jgi:hypothetical protein
MTVSYETARETVRAATEPEWPIGTYCLDDRRIVENDEVYVFQVGPREWLIDGDDSYAVAGAVPVVHKADGRLEWRPSSMTGTDPTITARSNPSPTVSG